MATKKKLKSKELLSEVDNENQMIVIDNGSDTIKIGFSGEDMPRVRLTPHSLSQLLLISG